MSFPEECTICLEDIIGSSSIGVIRGCSHYYHEHCIINWSNNSNSCPTCRKLFHNIDIRPAAASSVSRTVVVQDKLLANDAINDIPLEFIIPASHVTPLSDAIGTGDSQRHGICSICSSSDYRTSLTRSLMSCQSCDARFHMSCLGISYMTQIDDESLWVCPICDFQQEYIQNSALIRRRQILHPTRRPPRRNRREPLEIVDIGPDPEDFEPFETTVVQPSRVLNGGVLARKEQRQLESLTADELKSWEAFDRAKHGDASTDTVALETGTTRRKRKKKTFPPLQPEEKIVVQKGASSGPSRISNLISQMKNSSGSHISLSSRDTIDTSYASPIGGSPASTVSNFSPVTSGDEELKLELTFLQKNEIQKYIRDKLRPLYKKRPENETRVIRSEQDYIHVNKSASRKIYSKIKAMADNNPEEMSRIFDQNNPELKHLVETYVNNEINDYIR